MGGWVDQYQMDGRRKTKRFQRKSDAKAFIDSMNTAEAAVQTANVVQAASGVLGTAQRQEVITVGEWMDRR